MGKWRVLVSGAVATCFLLGLTGAAGLLTSRTATADCELPECRNIQKWKASILPGYEYAKWTFTNAQWVCSPFNAHGTESCPAGGTNGLTAYLSGSAYCTGYGNPREATHVFPPKSQTYPIQRTLCCN